MKENMDVRVSTHLYKFEKEQLDRIIKEKNIPTISQFIRELIREYLEKEKKNWTDDERNAEQE